MKRTPSSQRPQAVLFACGLNSVRSPMAAALLRQALGTSLYVGSAGVRKGELDPFAAAVMDEVGIDIKAHRPMTFEELEDSGGAQFRPHRYALARSASQGARAHAHARARRRVLAHRRSDRDRGQPGAAHECVPRRARPTAATDQDTLFPAPERQRMTKTALTSCRMALIPLGFAPSGRGDPPCRVSRCGGFEVPIVLAARSLRSFKSKNRTGDHQFASVL